MLYMMLYEINYYERYLFLILLISVALNIRVLMNVLGLSSFSFIGLRVRLRMLKLPPRWTVFASIIKLCLHFNDSTNPQSHSEWKRFGTILVKRSQRCQFVIASHLVVILSVYVGLYILMAGILKQTLFY